LLFRSVARNPRSPPLHPGSPSFNKRVMIHHIQVGPYVSAPRSWPSKPRFIPLMTPRGNFRSWHKVLDGGHHHPYGSVPPFQPNLKSYQRPGPDASAILAFQRSAIVAFSLQLSAVSFRLSTFNL